LALVGATQILLGSCVGGAGVDEGQARVNRFVVVAPCPRRHPQPDAVLLKSHRGFVVEASLRLGPGPRLGSEEAHKTVDLVVVLAESTNDNGLAYSSKSRRPRGCHVEKAREGTHEP
jgi:hypothetical protein